MSKGDKPKDDVFDVERIRQIIKLMEQHDLSEVDLQQGDEKIKLNRGSVAPVYAAGPVAAPVASPAATPADADLSNTTTINSPMVGTYFARADPESAPFVKVGDNVSDDTVVCIIEAMKVFNEIPAECSGKIIEILVEDQQPVDYGKPMFRIQSNT